MFEFLFRMKPNYNQLLFVFLLLAAVFPFLWIAFYCHPAADDYAYAWSSKEFGIMASCKRDYFNWNGRYFSNVLMFCNPIAFNSFKGYQLVPVLLIFFTFFSIWLFLKEVFRDFLSKIQLLSWSLLLCLLFLIQMPQLAQGIYWYTGAVSYQGACILTLMYITHLLRFTRNNYLINRQIDLILLGLELFCIVGFNETAMLQLLFLHFLCLIYYRLKWFITLSAVLLMSVLIVVLAPGNEGRAAHFQQAHQFMHSLGYSAMQTFRFLLTWVSSYPLFFSSLLFIPIAFQLQSVKSFFLNRLSISPKICFLILVGLIFISVFPAYWSTGILGQHRTLNAACFLFVCYWFVNLYVWIKNYNKHPLLLRISEMCIHYKTAFLLLLFCSFFIRGNLFLVSKDLWTGSAKSYHREMQQRYTKIASSKSIASKNCILDSLMAKPESIYSFDISADSTYWMNRGEAAFFGLENIRVAAQKN